MWVERVNDLADTTATWVENAAALLSDIREASQPPVLRLGDMLAEGGVLGMSLMHAGLQAVLTSAMAWVGQVDSLLTDGITGVQRGNVEGLVARGAALGITMPQVEMLRSYLAALHWEGEARKQCGLMFELHAERGQRAAKAGGLAAEAVIGAAVAADYGAASAGGRHATVADPAAAVAAALLRLNHFRPYDSSGGAPALPFDLANGSAGPSHMLSLDPMAVDGAPHLPLHLQQVGGLVTPDGWSGPPLLCALSTALSGAALGGSGHLLPGRQGVCAWLALNNRGLNPASSSAMMQHHPQHHHLPNGAPMDAHHGHHGGGAAGAGLMGIHYGSSAAVLAAPQDEVSAQWHAAATAANVAAATAAMAEAVFPDAGSTR